MDNNQFSSARGKKSQSLSEDCFLDLKELSERTSIGVRSLRNHIKNPSHPLTSYRVGGKILVNWLEFKEWIEKFRSQTIDLDKMVDKIVEDLIEKK